MLLVEAQGEWAGCGRGRREEVRAGMYSEQEKIDQLLAEIVRLKSDRDEALLNARQIEDAEFLRRALALEFEGSTLLTPFGRVMQGLRRERDEAFQRGYEAGLVARAGSVK